MSSDSPDNAEEPTTTKKHDISDLEFWKELAVNNVGLAVTATSVLIAGTRVALVSGGNLQLAGSIIQSMNVLNLIFVTLLPVIPYIIQIAIIQYLYNHRESNNNSNLPLVGKLVLWTLFAISLMFVPVAMVIFYALLPIGLYFLKKYVLKSEPSFEVSIPAFATFLIFGAALQANGPWLPMEQIQVKNEGTVYAYVLSSDVRWTTALTKNKSIRIYTTSDLESRTICNGRLHWSLSTLASWRIGEDLPSCK
ncbi:hypothetical protein ACFVX3_28695 [Rhodococcus erythropolis]